MTGHRLTRSVIASESRLREIIGEPTAIVCAKVADRLNALTRTYIERSPFMMIATADERGTCDLSPRGDPAGFVQILDDLTLLLPERPGNRIADTLTNIVVNPHVGLLFLVPGVTETFRVNGRATITDDRDLLARCVVEGKTPKLGIIVDIQQAYTQCSKALLRSELWNAERFLTQAEMPTNGEIQRALAEQRGVADFDAAAYDAERAERYARREGFY